MIKNRYTVWSTCLWTKTHFLCISTVDFKSNIYINQKSFCYISCHKYTTEVLTILFSSFLLNKPFLFLLEITQNGLREEEQTFKHSKLTLNSKNLISASDNR